MCREKDLNKPRQTHKRGSGLCVSGGLQRRSSRLAAKGERPSMAQSNDDIATGSGDEGS